MRGPLRLALFVLALGTVSARAGDVYVIDNAAGKSPVGIKKDAFALTAVPAMGEGKPNEGFAYTTALELAGTGVQIARGRVEPGGPWQPTMDLSNTFSMSSPGAGRLVSLTGPARQSARSSTSPTM